MSRRPGLRILDDMTGFRHGSVLAGPQGESIKG
jgi:hypothetical protein